ncbi:MAG: hypothetical protein HOA00_08090 [Rhodospirillaceae bacterium]|nr:hypothetical protein [Rhodospirillaceae bacterium]
MKLAVAAPPAWGLPLLGGPAERAIRNTESAVTGGETDKRLIPTSKESAMNLIGQE